jgi:hypothetical protein
VEAPCAPLTPSGFEPVAFAARGKRLRHRAIHRSRFCWPANWRDISTWLVLHCSAHAEAATFGQLGLQLENGLVEIFLLKCGTLVLASCGLGERCQRAGCVAVAVLLRPRGTPPPGNGAVPVPICLFTSASEGIGGARGLGNLVRPESHPEPRGFPVQWADPGVKSVGHSPMCCAVRCVRCYARRTLTL